MKKAEVKTKPTKVDPNTFVKTLKKDEQQIATELIKVFEKATGWKCVMWGKIFGFGLWHYVSPNTGRFGDWPATGFAMRTTGPVIYTMLGHKNYPEILAKLGKYKDAGKSCLGFKKLEDIDMKVLQKIIKTSLADMKKKYEVE